MAQSRYQNLYQYNYKGRKILFSASFLPTSYWANVPKTYYQVQSGDRLDKIAHSFYDGNADLQWIIMMANGMELPTDMLPGTILMIPLSYNEIVQAVTSLNKNG